MFSHKRKLTRKLRYTHYIHTKKYTHILYNVGYM